MSILGSLGSLVLSFATDNSQLVSGLSAAEQAAKASGKELERALGNASDAIGAKIRNMAVSAASIGTIISAASQVRQLNASTAALDDMSERTGVAVEELSR